MQTAFVCSAGVLSLVETPLPGLGPTPSVWISPTAGGG